MGHQAEAVKYTISSAGQSTCCKSRHFHITIFSLLKQGWLALLLNYYLEQSPVLLSCKPDLAYLACTYCRHALLQRK